MDKEANKETKVVKEEHDKLHELSEEARPLAYTSRVAAIMKTISQFTKIRPMAYASEVGESFRPLFPLWTVRTLYGVSWAYVILDTAVKTYEAKDLGKESMMYTAVDMSIFHSVASMALPAFTIHTIVHQSSKIIQKTRAVEKLKRFGPVGLGLASIPFIIQPIDHGVEWIMDNTIRKYYGNKIKKHSH